MFKLQNPKSEIQNKFKTQNSKLKTNSTLTLSTVALAKVEPCPLPPVPLNDLNLNIERRCMMTNKILYASVLVGILCLPCFGEGFGPEKELVFTPAEVESMLFLYNQAPVKGSEAELVAPVGKKLKEGLKEARALEDTTGTITLKLNLTQLQVCMSIVNNSTFEAKYAELVSGMKRKLRKLLPPPPPADNEAAAREGSGSEEKKGGER